MTIIKLYVSLNTSHFIGFLEKVKQGKAQAAGSGFGGKGLDRLDKERDAKEKAERKAYGEGEEKPEEKVEEVVQASFYRPSLVFSVICSTVWPVAVSKMPSFAQCRHSTTR